ncbi:NusB antitermination factor [Viridibacillus arenosi FSL R5-213]|uniref:NusB antitermination factor n=1 Tax=Viridibacillus arenosi FSL R5-213 TaxID=1227360 RepID=W4EJY1_9BACL|nr:NusB antitermination factor [Viridibacillus arenosi FSL R5-213]
MDNQYVVGWGTLMLINAGIAQGKNRSGFNWFLLSLFLGPIATLILVLVDKK